MKVNVLGTEYTLTETTQEEREELKNADGWCGHYDKEILIESNPFRGEVGDFVNAKAALRKVAIRHEITHAFVYESGGQHSVLDHEYCVHWIAVQFPKLLKAFQDVGAI